MTTIIKECSSKILFVMLILLTISIIAFIHLLQQSSLVSLKNYVLGNTTYKTHDSNEAVNASYGVESYGIAHLAKELSRVIDLAKNTPDLENITLGCTELGITYPDECNQTNEGASCLQPTLPEDFESRIKQLVFNDNLLVPNEYRDVIKSMTEKIDGFYDVIIVSALSSNHFKESQALLNSLHNDVLPLLTNYLLVMFNIGLIPEERKQLERHCRCTVVDFPFDKFPPHFKTLKCFAWKPIAVSSVYSNANVVIWTDCSIRFTLPEAIPALIEKTKRQGIVARLNPYKALSPYYTLEQMFRYFGDSPCAHLPFLQVESGYEMIHWEPLMKKAVVDPWVACALRPECTCPVPQHTVQNCPLHTRPPKLGFCMRNDQSSLTIILSKLFREKYHHFVVRTEWFIKAMRGDELDYFKILENNTSH